MAADTLTTTPSCEPGYLLCRRGGKGRGAGGVKHIEVGKDAAIEAEMQASRERAVVPLESRVQQFMEMLAEKEVLFLLFSVTLKLLVGQHDWRMACEDAATKFPKILVLRLA